MENLFQTVYIKQDEEIPSILGKIIERKVSRIFLAVPAKALLFHSPISLRILKEETDKRGIKLIIVTVDEQGQILSKKIGIECFSSLPKDKQRDGVVSSRKKPQIWMNRKQGKEIREIKEVEEIKRKDRVGGNKILEFFKNKFGFIAAGCVMAAILFFTMSFLPLANVFVSARAETFNKEIEAYIDTELKEPILSEKKMPGKIIEVKKEFSQNFSATGKKDIKNCSKGDIVMFNEWDSSGQSFPKGTELISESGKIFVSSQPFSIPGFFRLGGKDIAGQVKISAVAKEAGSDYNISQQKFFIASLKNSEKYAKIYGRSYSLMSGGEVRTETVVSKSDIDDANKAILQQAESGLKDDIAEGAGGSEIIVGNSIENKFSKMEISAKEGDVIKEFTAGTELSRKTWSVNKEMLKSFLKGIISQDSSIENFEIDDNSIKILFLGNKGETIKVSVKVSVRQQETISAETIKKNILGKSKSDAEKILSDLSSVEGVSIKFWPFWNNGIPKNKDRVNVFLDKNN